MLGILGLSPLFLFVSTMSLSLTLTPVPGSLDFLVIKIY